MPGPVSVCDVYGGRDFEAESYGMKGLQLKEGNGP